MDRYTRRDAERAFEHLTNVLDKKVGHYRPLEEGETSTYGSTSYTTNPGGWALDYNPTYGGCVVTEIAPDGGTWISHPLGDTRRSPREFCDAVSFALRVLHEAERAR